jgi:toluene monooxygenase system protein A
VAGAGWEGPAGPRCFPLDHQSRRYIFCSEECRWIFQQEPERYQGHLGFIDRVLAGQVPSDFEGALRYMGLFPGERGDDAEGGRWVESHRQAEAAE